MELDDVDWDLLALLQTDASLSNLALAERTGISPPTALRRVRHLYEAGLIMRTVALLDEDRLSALQGHGLSALAEVSLDRQGAEHLDAFERRAVLESAVHQCWRVTPGPDFMLVLRVRDMPAEEWRRVLEVNLTGAFLLSRACAPPIPPLHPNTFSFMSFRRETTHPARAALVPRYVCGDLITPAPAPVGKKSRQGWHALNVFRDAGRTPS